MNTRKHLLVASMTFALAACGGGGGGGGGSEPAPENPVNTGDNPAPEATIAALCDASYETPATPEIEGGIVGGTASSVRGATVGIYEWDGQAWSAAPIATATTGDDGRFAFNSVTELSGPVRFELTSTANTELRCESPTGCGTAEAGDYYPAPADYQLNTLVNGEGVTTVALSPVTNMAAQWAMDMPRGVTVEGIKLSSARMYSLLGGQVLTGSGELSTADIESLLTQYPQYAGAAQPLLEQIPRRQRRLTGLHSLPRRPGSPSV
jgi:hypothetical protein